MRRPQFFLAGMGVCLSVADRSPPAIARFVKDMKAFFAEPNQIKRDEIAARQLHALKEFPRPREKKLRLADVIEMFAQMKGLA